MKKFFLASLIAVAFNVVSAQSNSADKARAMVAKLEQIAGLSTAQTQQLTPFLSDCFTKFANYQAIKTSNPANYQTQMNSLKGEFDNKINQVLTKEQVIKYQAFRKKEISEGRTPFAEFVN